MEAGVNLDPGRPFWEPEPADHGPYMHTGLKLREWLRAQPLTARQLGEQLPNPVTRWTIWHWQKQPYWCGGQANGMWFVRRGILTMGDIAPVYRKRGGDT